MIMTLAGELDLARWLVACRPHKTLSRQFDRLTGAQAAATREKPHVQ